MKFEWEAIHQEDSKSGGTSRARVPGGWLVTTVIMVKGVPAIATCFVSDPQWHWDVT